MEQTGMLDYDMFIYEFHFKRHPNFYVTVIIVPSLLLAAISTLTMLVPVESGEKVSLSMTLLLSQALELLVLSEMLPASNR